MKKSVKYLWPFLIGSFFINSAVADSRTIYETVPSASEMADKLFGSPKTNDGGIRWKSIRMTPSTPENPNTQNTNQNDTPGIIGYRIEFGLNSDQVQPSSHHFLNELAELLKSNQMAGKSLIVEGHTDAIGDEMYNMDLGARRAHAVVNYLVLQGNVPSSALKAVSKGEFEPLDSTNPNDKFNRRVEFYLPGTK